MEHELPQLELLQTFPGKIQQEIFRAYRVTRLGLAKQEHIIAKLIALRHEKGYEFWMREGKVQCFCVPTESQYACPWIIWINDHGANLNSTVTIQLNIEDDEGDEQMRTLELQLRVEELGGRFGYRLGTYINLPLHVPEHLRNDMAEQLNQQLQQLTAAFRQEAMVVVIPESMVRLSDIRLWTVRIALTNLEYTDEQKDTLRQQVFTHLTRNPLSFANTKAYLSYHNMAKSRIENALMVDYEKKSSQDEQNEGKIVRIDGLRKNITVADVRQACSHVNIANIELVHVRNLQVIAFVTTSTKKEATRLSETEIPCFPPSLHYNVNIRRAEVGTRKPPRFIAQQPQQRRQQRRQRQTQSLLRLQQTTQRTQAWQLQKKQKAGKYTTTRNFTNTVINAQDSKQQTQYNNQKRQCPLSPATYSPNINTPDFIL